MAVVKRRPVPKSSDLVKDKEVTGEKVSIEPKIPFGELLKERRMQSEVSEHEEVQEMQETEELDNREEKEVIIDNTQETNKTYDLEMFQPALSKTTSRSNSRAGVMSVVNSNCGKRVMLSKELMDRLNNPSKISMSFSEEYIAVGATLPNNNNQLTIKLREKKGVIYSVGIVSEITDKYGLDFSNRTSITFSEVDYIEVDGSIIAIMKTKQVN
jgi:hypothetical protein